LLIVAKIEPARQGWDPNRCAIMLSKNDAPVIFLIQRKDPPAGRSLNPLVT